MTWLDQSGAEAVFRGTVDLAADLTEAARIAAACSSYRRDDEDEDPLQGAVSCFGCRYRRWVPGGFTCLKHLLARGAGRS